MKDKLNQLSQEWVKLLKSNVGIEPSPESSSLPYSMGYQLYFNKVTSFKALQSSVTNAMNNEYQLRLSFYDVVHKKFIGKTYSSKFYRQTDQEVVLNMPIYFHSTIADASLVLVVEVVSKSLPKNPLPETAVEAKISSIGWGSCQLFRFNDKLFDVSEELTSTIKMLQIYRGSPKALLYIEDSYEAFEGNEIVRRNATGSMIEFSMFKHSALFSVSHLMIENHFYGHSDKIPGLKNEAVQIAGTEDYDLYVQPSVAQTATCYLENIKFHFATSVQSFEQKLCVMVLSRCVDVEDGAADSDRFKENLNAYVAERRLEICAHNGHCFIQSPQYNYLESESKMNITKNSSFGKGKQKFDTTGKSLILRSRLQLDEFPIDSNIAIVFKLHYLLMIPNPEQDLTSAQGSTYPVMVAWTAWCPFNTASRNIGNPINLVLYGGSSENPYRQLFYNISSKDNSCIEKLSFNFTTTNQPITTKRISSEVSLNNEQQIRKEKSVEEELSLFNSFYENSDRYDSTSVTPAYSPEISPKRSPYLLNRKSPRKSQHNVSFYGTAFREIVDEDANKINSNLPLHLKHKLMASEIILQFQAIVSDNRSDEQCSFSSVFFTTSFYRFDKVATRRASLGVVQYNESTNEKFRVLHPIKTTDAEINDRQAGVEASFKLDLTTISIEELNNFHKYLQHNSLHVDVWNGDNFMLIGTASLPLRELVRQNRPSVAVDFDVDIIHTEYSQEKVLSAHVTDYDDVIFNNVTQSTRGKLYVKVAHIGCASKKPVSTASQLKTTLIEADITRKSFHGGTLTSINNSNFSGQKCRRKVKPEKIKLLNSITHENETEENSKERNEKEDEVYLRKVRRMEAVRKLELNTNYEDSPAQRAILQDEQFKPLAGDLAKIMKRRDANRDADICQLLMHSITTTCRVHVTMGTAHCVEYKITNPYDTPQWFSVQIEDSDLTLITDVNEWKYFKKIQNLTSLVDEKIYTTDDVTGNFLFKLKPCQSTILPFRYQFFNVTSSNCNYDVTQPSSCRVVRNMSNLNDSFLHTTARVIIKTKSDDRPISILKLDVVLMPCIVNNVFRFTTSQNMSMKKCIRLQPNIKYNPCKLMVVCSDDEIVCHSRSNNNLCEIFLKYNAKHSNATRKFRLYVFCDKYSAVMHQSWLVLVEPICRYDVTVSTSVPTTLPVVIRGNPQSDLLLQCFASEDKNLKINPCEAFVLSAGNKAEVELILRNSNKRFIRMNVLDVEFHKLYKSFLVFIKHEEPIITKEFNLDIPSDSKTSVNKMISYTNPYKDLKIFKLETSRPDLLKFREGTLKLSGCQKTNIGLRFQPGFGSIKKAPVFVYINDENNQNEESFLINISYVS